MENEVHLYKNRMEEYKEQFKSQKDKSKRIVMACMTKLEEKEVAIDKIREDHDKALAFIARELSLLQSQMCKEQRRLQALLNEKTRAAEALSLENERLKKQNKKLQSNVKMLSPDHDMDTPSSEDCSPKSSFSSKAAATKVEVKGRPSIASTTVLPSTTPLKRPPPPPPPTGPKPPVPSRAGVNKKLCQSPPTSAVSPTQQAPQPPKRSSSLHTSQLERVDSGRESDLTSDVEHQNYQQHSNSTRIFLNQDEGFCSSHEDHNPGGNGGRVLVNHHRGMQKPSDLKLRAKVKAMSVLEEAEVGSGGGSGGGQPQKTTVTYWTEPYL